VEHSAGEEGEEGEEGEDVAATVADSMWRESANETHDHES
jgi:hypothetical protein